MTEFPSLPTRDADTDTDASANTHTGTKHSEDTKESVLKIRVDQSWNVRLLWEGRVKELLVSAGVGLGPGSFSPSSLSNPSPGSGSAGQGSGGGPGMSYWRGVGVSVLYSS